MSSGAQRGEIGAVRKRAPTLWIIILVKITKGVLLLLLGLGFYSLSDNNLPQEFRHVLLAFNLDPEKKFFVDLARNISQVTPANIYWVAGGTIFYSSFSLVEGIGLMFRVA